MNSFFSILLLAAFPCLILSSQYVPFTGQIAGITKGSSSASFQVELIYDPACDDTAQFDQKWQTVEAAVLSDPDLSERVRFRYLPMPLPYHFTAHKLVQAIYYTMENKGQAAALADLRYFLSNLHDYSEAGCMEINVDQMMAKIAKYLSEKHGFNQADVTSQLQHGSTTERKVRQWSKFIMGILHTSGTPTAMVNWVRIDGGIEKSKEEWIALLKKLVPVVSPRKLSSA